jgi:hypothetical protein
MNREVHVRFWESAGLRCPAPLNVCCERLVCKDQTVLYRRWRRTLRSRSAGAGSKPPQAAGVKSPGGERCGKGGSNSVRYGSRRRT